MARVDITEYTCANCIGREDRERCDCCDGSCYCDLAVDNGYSIKEAVEFNREYR